MGASAGSPAATESSPLDSSGFDTPEGSARAATPAGSAGPSERLEPLGTSTSRDVGSGDEPADAVDCDSPESIARDYF